MCVLSCVIEFYVKENEALQGIDVMYWVKIQIYTVNTLSLSIYIYNLDL